MNPRARIATTAFATLALGLSSSVLGPNAFGATKSAAPTISIKNFAFNPSSVKGTVGQTLTVTNNDSTPHTFTGAAFDLGTVAPGKSVTLKLAKKGTLAFHCNFHSSMKGTIKVS